MIEDEFHSNTFSTIPCVLSHMMRERKTSSLILVLIPHCRKYLVAWDQYSSVFSVVIILKNIVLFFAMINSSN